MTITENLRKAQERLAEQRARALAARPTGKPSVARGQSLSPATPREERPSALATAPPPLLLSHADLRNHFGITYSRQHLHRLMVKGQFPRPVSLGDPGQLCARKVWKREDVEAWLAQLPYTNEPEAAE